MTEGLTPMIETPARTFYPSSLVREMLRRLAGKDDHSGVVVQVATIRQILEELQVWRGAMSAILANPAVDLDDETRRVLDEAAAEYER